MKVYSYGYNGKLIGETEAELCQVTEAKKAQQKEGEEPIESVFIIPSYATELPPPEVKENEAAFFIDGAWVVGEIIEPSPSPIEEHIQSYSEKRAASYPSFYDYLDGIVKGDSAQVEKYIADCLAVKKQFPKPVAEVEA